MYRIAYLALLAIVLRAPVSQADKWGSPAPKQVASPSGSYVFRVEPPPLFTLGPAHGKLYSAHAAEPVDLLWERQLVNEECPVDAVVSDQGYVATFDNWYRRGIGDHVVVVYDPRGEVVIDMELGDFTSRSERIRFVKSVSSIHWGRDHELGSDVLILKLQMMPWSLVDKNDVESYREWWLARPHAPLLRRIAVPSGEILDPPEEHAVNQPPPHDCPSVARARDRLDLDRMQLSLYCLREDGEENFVRDGPYSRWRPTSQGWLLLEAGAYEAGEKNGLWRKFDVTPPCERRYEAGQLVAEANCE